MFFQKSKPMNNYEHKVSETKLTSRNKYAPKIPSRILISGPSGCGKTNLLLNLIYDLLTWDVLYIYAKDISEQKYETLYKVCQLANVKNPFNYVFDMENIVDVDELDSSKHNLIVFDDFVTDRDNMDKISALFIRGRKKNATVIFLSQSYYATPKLIRLQCNYFCIFRPSDDREIGELHRNHNCGMNKSSFQSMFHEATKLPYSFFYLDKQNKDPTLQCRHNFQGQLKLF